MKGSTLQRITNLRTEWREENEIDIKPTLSISYESKDYRDCFRSNDHTFIMDATYTFFYMSSPYDLMYSVKE